jgi:hypothetical protein
VTIAIRPSVGWTRKYMQVICVGREEKQFRKNGKMT